MIFDINANPNDWKKECYISSLKTPSEPKYDEDGNEIREYDEPIPYLFNYQPLTSDVDLMEFGDKAIITQKAVIPMSYKSVFKENDLAYLEGVSPIGEEQNGDKANYRLLPPRNGNSVIIIYFQKLTGR